MGLDIETMMKVLLGVGVFSLIAILTFYAWFKHNEKHHQEK